MINLGRLVISGGTSGLGKAIVDFYKDYFSQVFILTSQDLAHENHGNVIHIQCDFKNPDFIESVLVKHSIIWTDHLIDFAGFMPLPANYDFLNFSQKMDLEVLDVNLTSHYFLMRHFIKGAVSTNRPLNIIEVASVCAVKPDAETPLYAAAKAGVVALAKGLALYNPQLIRVNCVSPGFFNTNLVPGDAPQDMLDAMVPQKREAQPEEIIPVIEMLLTSPFMTGSNIIIDGGQSSK